MNGVFGLLKKAGEFLAPIITTDSLAEIKIACDHAVGILDGKENEDTYTLSSSLDSVADYLKEEVGEVDIPCFNYIAEEGFTQKLSDSFVEDLPDEQKVAILKFFVEFLNTQLNTYYAQITIHRPFAQIVSKLKDVYIKIPRAVCNFITEIWNQTKKSPLVLEMMMISDGSKSSYPLLDFFADALLLTDDIGNLVREAILFLFSPAEPGSSAFDSSFREYLSAHILPEVSSFIANACECVATMQFQGSASTLLMWCDQFLLRISEFDCSTISERIDGLDDARRMASLAFLLAAFTCPSVLKTSTALATSERTLESIKKGLEEGEGDLLKSAIALAKMILLTDSISSQILPSKRDDLVDVIPLMPPTWLVELDGSTAFEAYEADAAARLNCFSQNNSENHNNEIFESVLKALRRFSKLPLHAALGLTSLVTLFAAAEPSLVCGDLAEAFDSVVENYRDVESFVLPDGAEDTPATRAAILAEFGKELHATYLAHEKLSAAVAVFDE